MRIATWNCNSIRIRLDYVERFVAEYRPDIICLQEIKAETALFPKAAFQSLDYRHQLISGMKSYNGVAILSRLPLKPLPVQSWCGKADCRHIAAGLPGGLELHNFYVPAGGDIPDPALNPKFAHKLAFVEEMTTAFAQRQTDKNLVLVGDLNIAPLEHDVWSHRQLLGVVSHTPAETERMQALQETLGWVDALRHFVPAEQKLYSWWSYRARDWAASDRGRRLDHIFLSPDLSPALKAGFILREARGWDQASDHVPVVIDLQ